MNHRRLPRHAPIPGTEPPVRALFVKRWGTLLELPAERPCSRLSDARFTPGALDGLFRASQAGWRLYLIGNEDDVARGRLDDQEWNAFQSELLGHLRSQGVKVARCYACLDHPQGKGRHRRKSVFLLPDTGLFFHATQEDGIALRESWVIGDATPELAAGERAGCRVASVRTGLGLRDGDLGVEPELDAENLAEALEQLSLALHYDRR